jgi:hypothetical protein
MRHTLAIIDPQYIDGRSADRCLTDQPRPLPDEVIGPVVQTRIEEGYQRVRFGIVSGDIATLVSVTTGAGQAKVAERRAAVVLFGTDVIDFMRQAGSVLRQTTILAAALGTFPHSPSA